jgi:predicted TIM-barrel fold metal-dependent hydrolase
MPKPITNAHIHVFDARCAPDRFFLVLPAWVVRRFAQPLKSLLMSRAGLALINNLSWLTSSINDKGKIARYIAFTKIGSERSQEDVFQMALKVGKQYDASIRLIGLTLNMDHMDSEPSNPLNYKNYATQLEEVKNIKRNSPKHFFPFLCIDPRHKTGADLRDWVKDQLTDGFEHQGKLYRYFYGLKIYPAMGFFPFDPALEEVYAYAEEYGIPIMTHCTRGGSQYIGKYIQQLIPKEPKIMLSTQKADDAFGEIKKLIEKYDNNGWIKNSPIGNNDKACDLFTHPQNYIPVLEKFPKLKICIAHMGGEGEFYKTTELAKKGEKDKEKMHGFDDLLEIRPVEGDKRWLEWIQEMMIK